MSVEDLQRKLSDLRGKLVKLEGLISSEPTNTTFLDLRSRLTSAIQEMEATATAPTLKPAGGVGGGSGGGGGGSGGGGGGTTSTSSTSAAASAPAAAAPARALPAIISAKPVLVRAPVQLNSSSAALYGEGGGGGSGAGAASTVRPAFRLVPAAGVKRARAEEEPGAAKAEEATDAAAEEEEGPAGQYSDLVLPDSLTIHLTDVRVCVCVCVFHDPAAAAAHPQLFTAPCTARATLHLCRRRSKSSAS
jgi:hypothetical protein